MPIRLTAKEAHRLLLGAGFVWLRSKGSHRIYQKNAVRIVVAFHGAGELHPKTTKEILFALSSAQKN